MLFLFKSFALSIAPDGITDFGIAHAKHCNLVFWSFVPRIDWLKPLLTDHAITCGINGLSSFLCLWWTTTIVPNGRTVRFYHTLPFTTKQRCSSAAATARLHQTFGIIDNSVATSDMLTWRWHQMWYSQINFWCLMLFVNKSDVDLFFFNFPLILGRKQVRFMTLCALHQFLTLLCAWFYCFKLKKLFSLRWD